MTRRCQEWEEEEKEGVGWYQEKRCCLKERRDGKRETGCGQYQGKRQHRVAAWKSGQREAGEPWLEEV